MLRGELIGQMHGIPERFDQNQKSGLLDDFAQMLLTREALKLAFNSLLNAV